MRFQDAGPAARMMQCGTIAKPEKGRTGQRKLGPGLVLFAGLMTVTPALADITNTATVTGTHDGNPVFAGPVTVNVPVTPQNSTLVVTKTADDTTDVIAGQTVTYTYTVENSGNVTLTSVSLGDSHNGSGSNPVPLSGVISTDSAPLNDSTDGNTADSVWDTLAPGDIVTFTSTYVVTQDDIDNRQ